jgi:hypothetical protein
MSYSLAIRNCNQSKLSWEFETNKEALELYNLLRSEFAKYEIGPPRSPGDKFVQVTIDEISSKSAPITMASFSSETYFDAKVYDQLKSIAEEECSK